MTWSIIVEEHWFGNDNDEDVKEIDKEVKLTKIFFLKKPGFLDSLDYFSCEISLIKSY